MNVIPDFSMATLQEVIKSLYCSMFLWGLLALLVLDIITGILKATVKKELDSGIGLKGMVKHTTIVLLVLSMAVATRLINMEWVSQTFCIFYILEYILSIVENLDDMGVPFPMWLRNNFKRMRDDANEKGEY